MILLPQRSGWRRGDGAASADGLFDAASMQRLSAALFGGSAALGLAALPAGAGGAGSVDHHAGAIDRANFAEARGQLDRIERRPEKIEHLAADVAEEMVVADVERFVAGLALDGFQAVDQTHFFKGGQGPVDGVERQAGQSFCQPFVQGFSRWVIVGLEQFAIHLQTLMGHFEAVVFAHLLKVLKLLLEVVFWHRDKFENFY